MIIDKQLIQSSRIGERYFRMKHSSGLTMLLYPMQGWGSTYAMFATNYGSVDCTFKTNDMKEFMTVPAGVAHFLEHKLFENEECDAFERYAKTGANANAYTSFEKTSYLFSCTSKVKESLEILLDFVTHPYFTAQTIEKEQGIIGQEIQMCDDNPEWKVFFNLLSALYHNNPVRIDIAGTLESIAQIDKDLLYQVYGTFYNLNNMVLIVAGNFKIDDVIEVADRILKPSDPIKIRLAKTIEPKRVKSKHIEEPMPVSVPLFHLGFKESPQPPENWARGQIIGEVLLELIASESSCLYRRLYDEGLINSTFDTEVFAGRDYFAYIFSGESRNPERVQEEIFKEITRYKRHGLDNEEFERARKAVYGRYLRMFSSAETIASVLLTGHFFATTPYDLIDIIASLSVLETEKTLLEHFRKDKMALSIIRAEQPCPETEK